MHQIDPLREQAESPRPTPEEMQERLAKHLASMPPYTEPTPAEQIEKILEVRGDRGQCQRCGLCCHELIIEAQPLDVLREPAIARRGVLMDGRGAIPPEEWVWELTHCGSTPCPFLLDLGQGRRQCGIYPTRPNVCITFPPGDVKCNELRRDAGLPEIHAAKGDNRK